MKSKKYTRNEKIVIAFISFLFQAICYSCVRAPTNITFSVRSERLRFIKAKRTKRAFPTQMKIISRDVFSFHFIYVVFVYFLRVCMD